MEYYNQIFEPANTADQRWLDQTFEQCTFKNLALPGVLVANSNFINCRFEGCDLTRMQVNNAQFNDVYFAACRLLYVDFSLCNAFGFHIDFENCRLDNAVFLDRKLKKARFIECTLKEAHFLKCDLTGSLFQRCNLEAARFEGNNLGQADFTSSYNLELNPDDNRLKKAKFSLYNLPGLLTRHDLVIKL